MWLPKYFDSFKKCEGWSAGRLILLLAYNEWARDSGNHLSFPQAYKQRKGNPNIQILIKDNYQGNLINVN